MTTLVIDASIAIKWLTKEAGASEALALRQRATLIAPELLAAECANVLWKKVRRNELSPEEALYAIQLLEKADVELRQTSFVMSAAMRIALALDHPVYDCIYLALAAEQRCPFVTADERLLRKLAERRLAFGGQAISLAEAAKAATL